MSEPPPGRARPVIAVTLSLAILAGIIFLLARPPAGKPVELAPPAPLRVQVSGAVANPGVYSLPSGSIVQDAVQAAGGPAPEADLERLNLAAPLADGDQVVIPAVGRPLPTEPAGQGEGQAKPPAPQGRINLNTASAAELESLPEIGPVTAGKIVEYRTTHGRFETVDDLLDVPGVGPKTLDAIRDWIEV